MAFINQFSFLLLAAVLLFILVMFLRRRGPAEGSLMAVLALFVGLAFAFAFFRPTGSDDISEQKLEGSIGTGQPVLLELQSPYCVACMAVEPIVKQLEYEYAGELDVVRVNVLDRDAERLLQRYQFQYTPTFVFLGPQGEEMWRMVGLLDPKRVAATLEEMR
jgi:thiol-disulfide isomerase/thioredoxin